MPKTIKKTARAARAAKRAAEVATPPQPPPTQKEVISTEVATLPPPPPSQNEVISTEVATPPQRLHHRMKLYSITVVTTNGGQASQQGPHYPRGTVGKGRVSREILCRSPDSRVLASDSLSDSR
ncbi:hypothetical protein CAPTEDRAFT_200319 [Capitella teleta]|uniref:Uncharacterized protein n=1 Tax=Capitella teleta TaxID=283909 RepID=R7USG2_CAPTE|nr:hypothetical protein CAPTEDRAFT_200319 [Capitella teleta]|eukprot:ELU09454.1 hypothetical protein CAPTEDRAFT_200319 [Capitella teleta]